jgi:3-oxoacyl-[acyl-carrier-protein] synthase II
MFETSIAITGIGIFCAAGRDVPTFTSALRQGKSGIGPVELFDVSGFPSSIGAEVRGYDPRDRFDRREAARLSRADQFAIIAAQEALSRSRVLARYDSFDLGVSVGAGAAGMLHGEQWFKGELEGHRKDPALLAGLLPDRTATVLANRFQLAGYQGSITTACSSSATAIGWGADLVATGRLKATLCGGTDALSLLTYAGFNSLRVVDPNPCAPFSLGREGISLGEGAAFLVLEREDVARERGAAILGRIRGYAMTGEGYHMTAPEPTGSEAARVMRSALEHAGVASDSVGWVNAHGTGTPLNDVVETKGMKLVFGQRAPEVPLISTKGLTGHCLGAAGAIEAAATIIALQGGFIPQTLHFRGADPDCDLEYCHAELRESEATVALSNSFAFGGNITTLVLGR